MATSVTTAPLPNQILANPVVNSPAAAGLIPSVPVVSKSRNGNPRSADKGTESPIEPIDLGKFAYLRFGNNEELIFNTYCQVQNLVKYFKIKLPELFTGNESLDLIDKDGNLKHVRLPINQTKLASEFLLPREIYILVDVIPMEVPNYFTCNPFLFDSELLTKEVLAKLTPKIPKSLIKKQQQQNQQLQQGVVNPKIRID